MKKIAIFYGAVQNDLQKRAIEELSTILLDYTLEYPVCAPCGDPLENEDFRRIYVGTKQNNPYIKKISEAQLTAPESYAITVEDDTVTIEGFDDAGVLYGVIDFYNRYIIKFEHPNTEDIRWTNLFAKDKLPAFSYSSAPSVKRRGLWTWGHVIYDYRQYLHNMMKLKMNSVIIWNDHAPVNAEEIIAYAHSCNIKVYWGYSWLWGTNCAAVDLNSLEGKSQSIFQKYEQEYAHLGADGIYFQTFTEIWDDNIRGVIIADAAAKFVNETSALFFEKYPDMEIQFGLHSNSVYNKLDFIKTVDPRVHIIWENCGDFPFSYHVGEESFEKTKDFVCDIATLRGKDDRFGVVTKAIVALDWPSFEHLRGPQCIGVSSEHMRRNRIERKSRIWKNVQATWLVNPDKAHQMIKHMSDLKNGDLLMCALVEDGMFEENIMYPVALYSEMLWSCNEDTKKLVENVAMRSYVTFA